MKPFDLLTSTISDVQKHLEQGHLSSAHLVELVLDQIEGHNKAGLNLRAVLSVAPRDKLLAQASALDEERKSGNVRSGLHGIPFLLKVHNPPLTTRKEPGQLLVLHRIRLRPIRLWVCQPLVVVGRL